MAEEITMWNTGLLGFVTTDLAETNGKISWQISQYPLPLQSGNLKFECTKLCVSG